jgi:prephenate dehydrogenase
VGLIGGSVGLAARRSGWDVVGVDNPEVLEEAVSLGAIDRPSTLKETRGADLVVLAAPISRVTDLVAELPPTDALVTDVASTKMAIVREAEEQGLRFVGGHPMAGSQLSGVAHARADLFKGARYFLTPTDKTDPEAYREVSGFVRDLGAVPTAVDPEKHDLLMAALSHLPHLMAAALLKVASDISPEALSFAGPSFRDLTRVGASNPSLWSDILAENAPALGEALAAFAGAMAQLGSEIKDREIMERRFLDAREAYDALGGILVEKSGENVELAVPVENRPGVFAEVTTLMGSNNINILDLYVRHSNTERAALVLTIDADAAPLARELLREAGFGAEIQG